MTDEERNIEKRIMPWRFWLFITFTLLLVVTFVLYLPTNFQYQSLTTTHMSPPGTSGVSADGHNHGAMAGGTALPDAATIAKLPLRTPANRIASLPFTLKDGVKEFRLEAGEFRWEYAPGQWVHAWGYNGQVPGPAIKVNEGDRVRMIVKNNLSVPTSVHWHGVDVPWTQDGVPGITQKAIAQGTEFTYEFTAKPGGTRYYHTHGAEHMTEAQQLDMGLSGPLIIEPENGISYDRAYTLVLDEWAILAGGVNEAVSHVHGAASAANVVPDFNTFTINGRIFPSIEPLTVKEGERVLLRMINAGSAEIHPMHLHGHNFTVVALDGNPVPVVARQKRNTLTLAAGETADVLVEANNPGVWLFHCHNVHHATAGMAELFQYEGFSPVSAISAVASALVPPLTQPGQATWASTPSTASVNSRYAEAHNITSGLAVDLSVNGQDPAALAGATEPRTGDQLSFEFLVHEKPDTNPLPLSALEYEHTKLMHVIGVRDDLNEFFHIHPEPAEKLLTFKDPKGWSRAPSSRGGSVVVLKNQTATITTRNKSLAGLNLDEIIRKDYEHAKIDSERVVDIGSANGQRVSGTFTSNGEKYSSIAFYLLEQNTVHIISLVYPSEDSGASSFREGLQDILDSIAFETRPLALLNTDITFKQPGTYKIWSEIKKDGTNFIFGQPPFTVQGDGPTRQPDEKIAYAAPSVVGDYQVFLQYDSAPVKGKTQTLSFDIHTLDGREVTVEDYVGAPMHLSMIKNDVSVLIHTHPRVGGGAAGHVHVGTMPGAPGAADESIMFDPVFPEAGIYRLFAQFRPAGINLPPDESLTATFWVEVKDQKTLAVNGRLINAIGSLMVIGLLMYVVRKFLQPRKI